MPTRRSDSLPARPSTTRPGRPGRAVRVQRSTPALRPPLAEISPNPQSVPVQVCRTCEEPFCTQSARRVVNCGRCRARSREARQLRRVRAHERPELEEAPRPAPRAFQSAWHPQEPHDLGRMGTRCPHCSAVHWLAERRTTSPLGRPVFTKCCRDGDVQLPAPRPPSEPLRSLLSSRTPSAVQFRRQIRQYNAAFAFTSLQYNEGSRVDGGIQLFQIHGVLYHTHAPLEATGDRPSSYVQTWLYDPDTAHHVRTGRNPNLDIDLLRCLADMLQTDNPFIPLYHTARERLAGAAGGRSIELTADLRLVMDHGHDRRRFNLPAAEEVAIVVPNSGKQPRPIRLSLRDEVGAAWQIIDSAHPAYAPLHYVLLFPHGDPGWTYALELRNADQNRQNTTLTQSHYYRYRLFVRENDFNAIQRACRLFQQYLVDAYAIIDQARLAWVEHNQSKLRVDLYNGLTDALMLQDLPNDLAPSPGLGLSVGRRVILPSSYQQGPRHYHQLYQDAMALVQRYGKPTLFVTFTGNPTWEEISRELFDGQTPVDRPDLVTRVFRLKLRALMKDIADGCFGPLRADVWVIEYQKRGLPHAHIVLWLENRDDFLLAEGIDQIISARIPAADADPLLLTVVKTAMVHGPCGERAPTAPCMVENARTGRRECSKGFPKPFIDQTTLSGAGYPCYARPDTPDRWFVKRVSEGDFEVTNQWIVPYNPWLSHRYQAHINVEICATIDAIRYLFKYVFKGTDQTGFEIQAGNEVAEYRQGRYIGPTQAAWHILEFPFHHQHPTVHALSVHLPDQQPVYFPDDLTGAELRERMETAKSQLMAFFDYYRRHPEAPKYHYVDFPQYFVWVQATRQWKTRERGFAIGRLYNCSPLHGERYYLRLLLLVVPGPTSFEDLRTVNGVVYPTFRAACLAAGLLDDDNEWFQAFDEAVQVATGWALRNLFTTALIYGAVADPQRLWDRYNTSICDDLPHRLRQLYIEVVDDDHLDFGLFLVKQVIVEEYARDYGQLGLAEPRRDWSAITRDHDHADDGSQPTLPRVTVEQLNRGQRACFDRITAAILDRPETAHFFIQGPGGTGKTFLYNCLYRWMTETGQKVLCVASSGIAAVLLPYGQTAHSQFTIPLEIHETSTCCVPRQSLRAAFLRSLGLIIWDEVPMQHRFCFEAVDRLMQDLHQNNLLFGGIPVVLGGDFAQILPVVKRGRRADIVGASLQRSYVWSRLEVLQLTENMRLQEGALNTQYAHWLRQLSYRPEYHSSVEIPEPVQIVDSLDTLLDHVFPAAELSGGQDQRDQIKFWAGRAILTVRNEHLGEINHAALSAIPGEPRVYQSVNTAAMDTTGVENDANMLPPEYLRAIDLPGLPPAQLQLKVGVPVMLLRNLRPRQGLCNGTRLLITALHRHLIEARILTGSWAGRRCVIPRVQLSSNDGDLHFTLTRRQFPVRLCFAMTVNKSQGQSLETVGLDLRIPVFSHGQLYVALSRVTDVRRLTVLSTPARGRTVANVVYPEVLTRFAEGAA